MFEKDKEILKKDEGLRLTSYICPAGKKTIGYGHNMQDNPLPNKMQNYIDKNGCITKEIAEIILENDILKVYNDCFQNFPNFSSLSWPRQHVIVNMIFNLGVGGFNKFKKLISAIDKEDWVEAAKQMENSSWFKQVGNRAKKLQKMMLGG